MAFPWMRRVLLALAPATLLALAACGSGQIESQFRPTRLVAFGDALTDMGNTGGKRYSVNDGTSSLWIKLVALDYGVDIAPSASGGTDYATGNARVVAKPDAAGNASTPTIKEQVDAFLAAKSTFTATDLVVVQGGLSDVIVQMQAFRAGSVTSDQLITNLKQAGTDLATQAKRVTASGAKHVVVIGAYDLARTPYGVSTGQQALLTQATTAFNDALLVALVNEGQNMLFLDAAFIYNLMSGNPATYNFTNVADPVCTSVDPGPGIGIGANQVNSLLCTPTTVVSGSNYSFFLWADPVYPTPSGHSRLADYVFSHVTSRW